MKRQKRILLAVLVAMLVVIFVPAAVQAQGTIPPTGSVVRLNQLKWWNFRYHRFNPDYNINWDDPATKPYRGWTPIKVGEIGVVTDSYPNGYMKVRPLTDDEQKRMGVYYSQGADTHYSDDRDPVYVYFKDLSLVASQVPAATPTPTPAPIAVENPQYNPPQRKSPCPNGWEQYTVLRGDTMFGIAWRHGFLWHVAKYSGFYSQNGVDPRSASIYVGQVLCLPPR